MRDRIGGRLKALTLQAPLPADASDIFARLDWWEKIVKGGPQRPVAYLLSPLDLSQLNKVFFAKVSIRDPAVARRFEEQCRLVDNNIPILCSRGIHRGIVIALVEE